MQKTTQIVYPTGSIADWQNGLEMQPYILPFLYNRDTFVAGSKLSPLKKPDFYKPSLLYISPDVKFQVSLPASRTQAIRMAFFYENDLIMNVTALDYFRQPRNQNFAFLVLDNSDLITGTLSTKGYANNNY